MLDAFIKQASKKGESEWKMPGYDLRRASSKADEQGSKKWKGS